MARFSDEFLQEIRDRCPIESVISDYVELKRSGANLAGLCPFHREKTPSFMVNPGKQIYKCFGCGEAGSVFNFIMKIEHVEFPDAVALLAKRAGMELPQGEEDYGVSRKRQTILAMNKEAARYFHSCLLSEAGRVGLEYLAGKRQMPMKLIRHFGLGFAPEGWDNLIHHLMGKGYTMEDLTDSGLTVMGKNGRMYDRFRGRVMFPIIDVRGNVVAFGGRVMDDSQPKYLNSPETVAFSKSRNLFGLNFAKNEKLDYMILAEGYMDVIALHGAGFRTAVASLGTSLTAEQARMILRYTKQVIISYDSDAAGQAASKRAISILKEAGVNVRVLTIAGGKDPDEYIRTYGAERFALMLKGSDNYIEYQLQRLAQQYDMENISQKVEFLRGATRILADIDSDVERELYMERLSKTYQISVDALGQEVRKELAVRRKKFRTEQKRRELEQTIPRAFAGDKDYNTRSVMAEQSLLALIYQNNDVYWSTKTQIGEQDFLNSLNSRIYRLFAHKIEAGEEVDVALLNEEFASDEISYITSILSREIDYEDYKKAAQDLMDVIRSEKQKMMALNSQEDDLEGMQQWYEQMRKRKK